MAAWERQNEGCRMQVSALAKSIACLDCLNGFCFHRRRIKLRSTRSLKPYESDLPVGSIPGPPSAFGTKIFLMNKPARTSQINQQIQRNHPTGKSPKSASSPSRKNILIFRNHKSVYIHRIPFHSEGRFANVTNVGMGCGGRSGDARRAWPMRTGEIVWA